MNVVGEESIGYLRETTGSMTCNFVLNCFKLYNYLDVGRLSNRARTAQRANRYMIPMSPMFRSQDLRTFS